MSPQWQKGGTLNWQLCLNESFGYGGGNMVAEFMVYRNDAAFTALTRADLYLFELDVCEAFIRFSRMAALNGG